MRVVLFLSSLSTVKFGSSSATFSLSLSLGPHPFQDCLGRVGPSFHKASSSSSPSSRLFGTLLRNSTVVTVLSRFDSTSSPPRVPSFVKERKKATLLSSPLVCQGSFLCVRSAPDSSFLISNLLHRITCAVDIFPSTPLKGTDHNSDLCLVFPCLAFVGIYLSYLSTLIASGTRCLFGPVFGIFFTFMISSLHVCTSPFATFFTRRSTHKKHKKIPFFCASSFSPLYCPCQYRPSSFRLSPLQLFRSPISTIRSEPSFILPVHDIVCCQTSTYATFGHIVAVVSGYGCNTHASDDLMILKGILF